MVEGDRCQARNQKHILHDFHAILLQQNKIRVGHRCLEVLGAAWNLPWNILVEEQDHCNSKKGRMFEINVFGWLLGTCVVVPLVAHWYVYDMYMIYAYHISNYNVRANFGPYTRPSYLFIWELWGQVRC